MKPPWSHREPTPEAFIAADQAWQKLKYTEHIDEKEWKRGYATAWATYFPSHDSEGCWSGAPEGQSTSFQVGYKTFVDERIAEEERQKQDR